MDILIHGKPNAGSAKATAGIESSLQQRIVDDFFASMEQHRYNNALIVDARNWKNNWYSVYTYWLGKNIRDTSGRHSYFAISIIVPNQYYCLVSEVFNHLSQIFENYVIGNYLTQNGNYIVQDLSDDIIFNGLVSKVNEGFVNLLEYFDSGFRPQAELANNLYYNVLDCDAKSFVEGLRKHGRVIVSNEIQTRDSIIVEFLRFKGQINNSKNQVAEKDKTISQLNQQIQNLQSNVNSSSSSVNRTVDELKNKRLTYESGYNNLKKQYANLLESNKSYEIKIRQISAIIGSPKRNVNESSTSEEKKSNKLKYFLSKIDTVLLFLIAIVVCFILLPQSNQKRTNEKLVALEKVVSQMDSCMDAWKPEIFNRESKYNSRTSQCYNNSWLAHGMFGQDLSNSNDLNCSLKIYQNNTPVNELGTIDSSKPIMILAEVVREGYQFYYYNLEDSEAGKLLSGEYFMLTKSDNQKPIIITYRTSDRTKLNEDNKLIFK